MKRLYYYAEKSKYIHIFLSLVFLFLLVDCCISNQNNLDKAILGIAIISIIINVYKSLEGITLKYKKYICISKGTKYKGRIIGKTGINSLRNGYFYKLVILYGNSKVYTPLIQAKYVDALKSKKCIVNKYNNNIYINGYSLCEKGDLPVKIRIIDRI